MAITRRGFIKLVGLAFAGLYIPKIPAKTKNPEDELIEILKKRGCRTFYSKHETVYIPTQESSIVPGISRFGQIEVTLSLNYRGIRYGIIDRHGTKLAVVYKP